jgi:hypothetical protein
VKTVLRALDRLERDGCVEGGSVPREQGHSGPSPRGYRLAPDAPIVVWRSTAALLVQLHHHTNSPVEEQAFIQEMVKQHSRDDAGAPLTAENVTNQLAWCVRKGYLRVLESDPGYEAGRRSISTTPLVDRELLFLERIIDRKDPDVGTQDVPEAFGSADPSAGGSRQR